MTDPDCFRLIRTADTDPERLSDADGRPPGRVFFHAGGVGQAEAGGAVSWRRLAAAGTELAVCETSWRRRFDGAIAAPFRPASLATYWQAVADTLPAGADMLAVIARAPADERDRRETAELLLAAGALDIPLTPVFRDAGRAHLDGAGARLWRQWTDYGFGRLLAVGATGGVAEVITAAELDALRRSAGRVLEI